MDYIDFEATVEDNNEVVSEDEVSDVDSLKAFVDELDVRKETIGRFIVILKILRDLLMKHQEKKLMRACVKLNNLMKFQTFAKVMKRKVR